MTATKNASAHKFSLRRFGSLSALLVAGSLLSACAASKQPPESSEAFWSDGSVEAAEPAASAAYEKRAGAPAYAMEEAPAEEAAAEEWEGEDDGMAMKADVDMAAPAPEREFNTEAYDHIVENRFLSARTAPLSTFSVDVDTASYSNVRRFLNQGSRPPAGAVRVEELVNYFDYGYEGPRGDRPFSVYTEVSAAPWAEQRKLLHIGIQGKRIANENLPPRNLVFLLDVSGSMDQQNKLPLLKRSLGALLSTMGEKDTVSIVVYAGASGMVLPPTNASHRDRILSAMDRLSAGGSTNGGEGIELAYELARRNFQPGGVNRVILATDGDFNVGTTNQSSLVRLIEKKRESGVFLTVLGFGMGNYKDSTLEKLADKGNGNYAYIDTFNEARKVLVQEGGANMVTIAKDVKIQVEMNPAVVGAYRLIGYENRALRAEDFNDDRKDAGEIGAGHTVTALYEIMSPNEAAQKLSVDKLKYGDADKGQWAAPSGGSKWGGQARPERVQPMSGGEMATVKLRYKSPQGHKSRLVTKPVLAKFRSPRDTSDAYRFSAAVASFGMLLRGSEYAGSSNFGLVKELARGSMGEDPHGHKREFLGLVRQAQRL